MYIHRYVDKRTARWHFIVRDNNGKDVAHGSRTYTRRHDLDRGLRRLKWILNICVRG